MAKSKDEPSAAEWQLLKAMWKLGTATVREVHEAVARDTGWAYTTVKTMLERMERKGLLRVKRVGPVKQFSPRRRAGQVIPRAIDSFVREVLGGSLAPLVSYLARARDLSEDDIRELRRIVEDEKGGK